jgi:hypothetical protein
MVKVKVGVFGGEVRTRAQSCEGSKKLIVNRGKGPVLEEDRKDRAKGCEFVICVSAQMAQDEVSRGRKCSLPG